MKNKWLVLLLLAVFFKGLIWLFLVPIFQVPDEPSHFSIVAFMAATGRRAHPRREVVTPSAVMKAAEAVNFDWRINHPVWQGYAVNWREQLTSLTDKDWQTVKPNTYQQSLKRPAGYYWLAIPFYWLGGSSFFGKFFSVRSFNLLIHLFTVWLTYLIGRRVFQAGNLGLAIAALVGFQPMVSFISSGVHYDPLAVLLATFFAYCWLEKRRGWAFLAAIAGPLVKPELIILILLWLGRRLWLGLAALAIIFGILAQPLQQLIEGASGRFDRLIYLLNINEYSGAAQFFWQSLISGRIGVDWFNYVKAAWPIHAVQVFPWYWGTFGWLEAPLPAAVFAGLKLVLLISFLGWVKYIHHHGFPRKMLFWLNFCLLQAAVVIVNDWQFFVLHGDVYGIQGRYFFPALVPQMLLLIFGLKQWLKEKTLTLAVFSFSLGLNLLGLLTVYRYFGWVWGN